MWQSFRAIDRGISEKAWRKKKKTSAVKHKPVRNGGSGRPKKDAVHCSSYYPHLLPNGERDAASRPDSRVTSMQRHTVHGGGKNLSLYSRKGLRVAAKVLPDVRVAIMADVGTDVGTCAFTWHYSPWSQLLRLWRERLFPPPCTGWPKKLSYRTSAIS